MTTMQGVLLDIDGTLVDSNDAHAHAWAQGLAENGYAVKFETVRPLIGMGGDKLLPKVCGLSADSPEGKRVNQRREEIFTKDYVPHLRPCRGAKKLLDLFANRGFRQVAASSAKKAELEMLLRICGADQVVSAITSSDDAEHTKPDPDILHAALEKIGLPPLQVAMLGDTPYDIEASRRAGIRVVALRCGGWKDADLAADAIYDDPADLATHFDDSLFMQPV
jgi:phosphoglycolate phosphatase-like HAD superfamily hydrolase